MTKARVFIGSSSQQLPLVDRIIVGLKDIADIEPWKTSAFEPGVMTLEALTKKTTEVDFAVLVLGPDDSTSGLGVRTPQASPRDNVVFEAGLFAGVLGIRRSLIVYAKGVKMPSDLLGLTCLSYDSKVDPKHAAESVCAELRLAISKRGRRADESLGGRLAGGWWQFNLRGDGTIERAHVSHMEITVGENGLIALKGHAWDANGRELSNFRSLATKPDEKKRGLFYYWQGSWPRHKGTDEDDFSGTGLILLESQCRARGHYTTRVKSDPSAEDKTHCTFVRAQPEDAEILGSGPDAQRAELIKRRLKDRKSIVRT